MTTEGQKQIDNAVNKLKTYDSKGRYFWKQKLKDTTVTLRDIVCIDTNDEIFEIIGAILNYPYETKSKVN